MKKLSPIDLGFISLESAGTLQNISCIAFLDTALDPKVLDQVVDTSVQSFRSMQYNPEKEKRIQLLESLDEYREILVRQFSLDKNSWGLFYCNNKPFISFVLNHALGDGVSGLSFFHSITDKARTERRSEVLDGKIKLLGALGHLIKEFKRKKDSLDIQGKNSQKRELILLQFPYSTIQKLKKRYVLTAYPILLSFVSLLISNYVGQENALGKTLSPLLPVSLRKPGEVSDLSNRIGGATISLPLGIYNLDELTALISQQLRTTLTENAYHAYYLWASILAILPKSIRNYLTIKSAKRTSFICTNLTGPKELFSIAGAKVNEQYVIPALMPGHGLGFGFMRSLGKMQIAIILDPAIINKERLEQALSDTIMKMAPEDAKF